MGKRERLKYVDIAKGLGIIAVLCAHTGINLKWIQPYYMPMFFALSGCVFEFADKGIDDCFKSAKKMVGVYLKYSIMVLILYIPMYFIKHNTYEFLFRNLIGIFYARKALYYPLGIEGNLIFMEIGNGPMWYIPCLSVSWILFAKLKKQINILYVLLYLVLSVLFANISIMLPWSIDTAFLGAVFIFFGAKYERFRQRIYIILREKETIGIATAFFLTAIFYTMIICKVAIHWNMSVRSYDTSISSGILFFVIFCSLGTFMMFLFCCLLAKLKTVCMLSFIGKHSLDILCFHSIIYQYFELLNDKFSYHTIPYIILKISFTIIGCMMLGSFEKKIENKLKKFFKLVE